MGGAVKVRIGDGERRARVGVRQALAATARVGTAVAAADAVVALHATDAATVFISACARMREPSVGAVERALYDDVQLVKLLAMRRTIFAVSAELAPYVDAAAARAIAAKERKTLLKHLSEWNGLDEAWLAEAEKAAYAVLEEKGEATGVEISAAAPILRTKITVFPGSRQEAEQGVATRVLRMLAVDGHIRRGRPRGSWTSSQFRWTAGAEYPPLPVGEAQAEVARRWLRAYGPGTEADFKWWSGWTLTAVRAAFKAVGVEEVELESGATGYVLAGDAEATAPAEPWAALLPGLDPTPMGWQDRGFFLAPEHRAALFDRAGNVGPTVWWNGEIVGGWAQRADGEVVWRLFTDVGRDAVAAIEAEAARLAGWVGEARVTPRFRTPLERELAG
ncbi:winged helix DNA-binding domain-containing protein [Streptomyces boninensis]|uniref:winged helix DNA-binding domain-containing protein n=1 Tax=Streptomyces boninensis TaxID=2039455 RepID=UPI003B22717E